MTMQRLHNNLAPIDILTREEMEQVLHKGLDAAMRERVRGLDSVRIPNVPIMATSTTQALYTSNDATPWGPEQGDVWLVRRAIVKSSLLTDNAKWVAYRGSAPSDVGNAYTSRYILDGMSAPVSAPVPSQPGVPASTVAVQNTNSYPVQVVISGGSGLSAVVVNGITVGTGDGTYTVPAYGAISVTYSTTAPTWVWSNASSAVPLGLNVNLGYYFSTKSPFLQPGEQIYGQVFNATVGAQYILDAEAVRCPAEMKGKLL
jgi:hypothetical protein